MRTVYHWPPNRTNLIAILAGAALALAAGLSVAVAAPHKFTARDRHAAKERAILACVDERTGPTGGLELDEAMKLCRSIARHDAKIAKLAKLAAQARSAGIDRLTRRAEWECAEEVSIACEDTTVRAEDHGECSDATLEAKHAFDVCRGKAPVAEGK
ncbi:MAG TPA: hypothetical protein VI172_16050 [Candidatus Dormibacteraeota bacterium]|jgi:hypothetical protein